MLVLLVRHARAGDRAGWAGDDRLRPLDRRGRRQAEALAPLLAERGVTRLLSSPYVRCVQTFVPAAAALGLELERTDALAEGARGEDVLRLLRSVEGGVPALSTHGDVIAELLGPDAEAKKGSFWELDLAADELSARAYFPPPA